VPEGRAPECTETAASPHAIEPAEGSQPDAPQTASPHALKTLEAEPPPLADAATNTKSAKRVKSKKARSRPLRSFLREVDLLR
jgi:hypothetical protein